MMKNGRFVGQVLTACALSSAVSVWAVDFTVTEDADFASGSLQSLNYDVPNSDQLQISNTQSTFPVLWIANAGEDSVSKLDSDNDCEVARYETWFSSGIHSAWGGPAPSRTAVDADGNVFVANRHFDGRPVAVLKILLEGGVDRNGNGVIDTSSDANGNCVIEPSEMIPLVDTNGNGTLEDSELADERVAFVEQVPGTNGLLGRSLCIAPSGNVWMGTYSSGAYYELDPTDGTTLNGPIATTSMNNYGCVINGDGILYGASLSNRMAVLDTNTKTFLEAKIHSGSNYGIAYGNNKVYLGAAAGPYLIFDPNAGAGEPDGNPATGTFSTPGGFGSSSGVGVDGNGDVAQGNTVIRKFDGATNAVLWQTSNPYSDTRGVVPDSNNNIWAVNRGSNNVTKFRGTDGQFLNAVPVGNQPYTYSDASGIGFQNANPNGIFTVVFDGVEVDAEWDNVSWNNEPEGAEPPDTSIEVQVRAANTEAGLPTATYVPMSNGASLGLTGQFLQVRVVMRPDAQGVSPILSDLVVSTVEAVIPASCDQDADGDVDIFDIRAITAQRNTAVTAATVSMDIDSSGVIDVNDSRQCVLQCTLPRCAEPQPL